MSNTFFHQATIQSITGGSFVNGTTSTLDKLAAAAAHTALHDAPARTDKSRCHLHTRTDVLDQLERWAQGICDEGASVFWLHGAAGAGKSAVMQSLAERCMSKGSLLGCFFFFRNDATRNTLEVLIPTLVYQIFLRFPSELHFLESEILDRDPGVLRKSFEVQLREVFFPVLRHLIHLGCISNGPESPRIFLIDGLDECNDTSHQQMIIESAVTVCVDHRLPVKFLVASRPELAISTAFKLFQLENYILGTVSLSDDPSADDDIRRFLEAEFDKIRAKHPFAGMISPNWPARHEVDRLVWKASSHFIYASVVANYIWTAQENPRRSLQVVLGLEDHRTNTSSPFAVLDALYRHILQGASHRDEVLKIIGHLLLCNMAEVSLDTIAQLCVIGDYPEGEFRTFMADMVPLIYVPDNPLDRMRFRHASLWDFLCDPSRSRALHTGMNNCILFHLNRYFDLFQYYCERDDGESELDEARAWWSKLHKLICSTAKRFGTSDIAQELVKKMRSAIR